MSLFTPRCCPTGRKEDLRSGDRKRQDHENSIRGEVMKGGTVLPVLCLFCFGRATIIQGTHQDVGISSVPSGATVSVDNRPYGSTPVIADLKRKDNHFVKVEKEGFDAYETTLTRKASG